MSALPGLIPGVVDVAIVGAGPAGMAAAIVLARVGVTVAVFDEGPTLGGQIYRGIAATPLKRDTVLGKDYWRGSKQLEEFQASGAGYFNRSNVWAIQSGGEDHAVAASRDGQAQALTARRVLIATGAMERPFPIPGWTLPGVLGAGAAQIALKTSALVPEGKIALAGTGPLLYLLASQYISAGVAIEVLLDTSTGWRGLTALPGFLLSPYARKGVALRSSLRGLRIERGVTGLRALGDGRLKRVAWHGGELAVDCLLLHQGVAPNLNLARATGCALDWDEERLAFAPRSNRWGETSVPGIFVAGDGAGIVGAEASVAQGRVAALQLAVQLGAMKDSVRDAAAMMVRRQLRKALRGRRFLDRYFRPADECLVPSGDTIVCRCEEVTAGQVEDAIAQGAIGPNQTKAYLRCGMGPCQGRYCGLTVSAMIAAATGRSPQQVGYFRLRSPVKPVTLGELASMPSNDAARRVVEPA
ncbi:MAG: NAD(P)/FAD-dependent oxidoreductase [Rhodospirillales bacterium]